MYYIIPIINPGDELKTTETIAVEGDKYHKFTITATSRYKIAAIHVTPESPDSSRVIVTSIIDEDTILSVYVRNLHPHESQKVSITYLETPIWAQ